MKEKVLDKQAMWLICLKGVEQFFDNKRKELEGYLQFNTVFVMTNDQELKIQLFLQKRELIISINEKLTKLGYDFEVKEVRAK